MAWHSKPCVDHMDSPLSPCMCSLWFCLRLFSLLVSLSLLPKSDLAFKTQEHPYLQ
jgi:hypothetical protein